MVLAWPLDQRLLVGVQDHVHGNVADGMRADAHAERVVELDGLVQLVLLDADQSLVVVIVAGNGLAEGSVLPREPTVNAHLDTANLQPLRAEAVHDPRSSRLCLLKFDSMTRMSICTRTGRRPARARS